MKMGIIRLDTYQAKWHWDYEESITSYYHIYSDDVGMVCYFEMPESKENSKLVQEMCDIHNKLLDKSIIRDS